MNFDDEIAKFTDYVQNNYDISNELISLKYVHTLNVVKVILMIAKKMNLSEKDTILSFYIALFHDLGRFREVERQHRFNNLTFDHGAYSNKILFNDGLIKNFSVNEDDYLLIKKAVYFHNKRDVGENLDERERFFAELLRDADRTDIFRVSAESSFSQPSFRDMPSNDVQECFERGESIDLHNLKTRSDRILLKLNFVKLFSSKEALAVLQELGYLDKYIEKINVSDNYKQLFAYIVENIDNYIEGVMINARQKVRSYNG